MLMSFSHRPKWLENRLQAEHGKLFGHGSRSIALISPNLYASAMCSLGFQTIYRLLNHLPDTVAERAFLPDVDETDQAPLFAYESIRPVSDFPAVAFSIGYELELGGLFQCLQKAHIPALRAERTKQHPWVVMGGPLTISNPRPLAPFADIIVMGEAETLLRPLLDALFSSKSRSQALKILADQPGYYVPSIHQHVVPKVIMCPQKYLPASAQVWTQQATWANMFLIEAARGCSRQCTFCLMQKQTCTGMRAAKKQDICSRIPSKVSRVGLVGAAVSDHPNLQQIVDTLIAQNKKVGLSSLRADRLTAKLAHSLFLGGYRTLTVAADGASEKLRKSLRKGVTENHLLEAARLVGDQPFEAMKLYVMLGVPEETKTDIEEFAELLQKQQRLLGKTTRMRLGVSVFVPKQHTPLANAPFVGIAKANQKMRHLTRLAGHKIQVKPASVRWAYIEYMLAQGNAETGHAALCAWKKGGRYSDWKSCLESASKTASKDVR